ncbi:Hsp20/alpha crystallin family protein [Natronococcus wangiae]|uniref:Hsp20/alpha crystallin family protein n=1 Tax=Natronococcus wangiae TaxID=3068275 RepID=UPI00273EA8B3|nr:Hsp20/alpha crystallin family protein [Natronococcus sp. AD5]
MSDALENLVEEGTNGTGSPTRSPRSRPTAGKRVNRNRRADSTKRKRTKRVREPSSDECFIDTRLTDDEFVVIADIPGARKGDISAGINPRAGELVIQKRGTVVGRADLPRSEPESMEAWFNNGVLEVHTRLEDAESLEELPS